jgi:hypothetical protein
MESETKPQMDDLVKKIGELAKTRNQLARQAEQYFHSSIDVPVEGKKFHLEGIEHKEDKFYSFYRYFLLRLFHEWLGGRSHVPELERPIGRIPYLDGGIFFDAARAKCKGAFEKSGSNASTGNPTTWDLLQTDPTGT